MDVTHQACRPLNGPKNDAPAVDRGAESASQHFEVTNAADQARKRLATARAKAALLGFALHLIGDGEQGSYFLVSGWNRSRTLHDIASVERFISQIGGRR